MDSRIKVGLVILALIIAAIYSFKKYETVKPPAPPEGIYSLPPALRNDPKMREAFLGETAPSEAAPPAKEPEKATP